MLVQRARKAVERVMLTVRTARYLSASQMFYYALRRGLPDARFKPLPAPARRRNLFKVAPLATPASLLLRHTFRFLNQTQSLQRPDGGIDWLPTQMPRLWCYHLHYFDFLRQADVGCADKLQLVQDWVHGNPPGTKPAWEPYTCSLRIVNWVMWLDRELKADPPQAILDSLYDQVRWLGRNVEKHILANHYFENLKALWFGTAFFHGPLTEALRKKISDELINQIEEQFLQDGGHFERSPQYNCRMLENLLDLFNLTSPSTEALSVELCRHLTPRIERALHWIQTISFPDGAIPLFGDSTFEAAPCAGELTGYAMQLSLRTKLAERHSPSLIDLRQSGLFGCRSSHDMLIITCGDASPAYQPGHAHCDLLSYELMLKGKRIIVDSGVCEYEPGERRDYVRSTRAHNTIVVDGADQSEVWDAFRMARRARTLSAHANLEDTDFGFEGAFCGFPTLPYPITHQRNIAARWSRERDGITSVQIDDLLSGEGTSDIRSYIHLHPDISIRDVGPGQVDLCLDSVPVASIRFDPEIHCKTEIHTHCPKFGVSIPNSVLVFSLRTPLPARISVEIVAASAE